MRGTIYAGFGPSRDRLSNARTWESGNEPSMFSVQFFKGNSTVGLKFRQTEIGSRKTARKRRESRMKPPPWRPLHDQVPRALLQSRRIELPSPIPAQPSTCKHISLDAARDARRSGIASQSCCAPAPRLSPSTCECGACSPHQVPRIHLAAPVSCPSLICNARTPKHPPGKTFRVVAFSISDLMAHLSLRRTTL